MVDLEYPFIMIHYLDVYPVVLFGYHNVAYFVVSKHLLYYLLLASISGNTSCVSVR